MGVVKAKFVCVSDVSVAGNRRSPRSGARGEVFVPAGGGASKFLEFFIYNIFLVHPHQT